MNIRTKIARSALALTAVVLAHAASAGPTPNTVTIDETSVLGAVPGLKPTNVNQLSGLYDEAISFGARNTFQTEAYFQAIGWNVPTQLNAALFGYAIYAKFSAAGTYSTTGSGTIADPFVTKFNAPTNYIELWLDKNKDTKYGIKSSATGNISNLNLLSGAGSTSDDFLLGKASLTTASGGNTSSPSVAIGNFKILFGDFQLSNPSGENYFVAPRPFYLGFDLNGNFQSLVPTSGTSIQVLQNSANGFFFQTVPEPASVALVGVALIGAAGVARRRQKRA